MAINPPQGVAASRGGLKIAISKSPVYDTLVVREDVPVWVKALTPKAEIDLEKMTFGSIPVDGTLEYLELVGVPGGDKVLFIEDDAEFLMDFYYQLEEILNTDDFLEHIAYLNGTDFIISAHRADSQLRVAITRQPHSDLRFLSSTEVEVSLSQYVNAWRRLAHALVAAAGKVSAVKPESQGETPAD